MIEGGGKLAAAGLKGKKWMGGWILGRSKKNWCIGLSQHQARDCLVRQLPAGMGVFPPVSSVALGADTDQYFDWKITRYPAIETNQLSAI